MASFIGKIVISTKPDAEVLRGGVAVEKSASGFFSHLEY
jgi:hypothetical protein